MSATLTECQNPECGRTAKRAGLCDPCYVYRRRHKGEMRPISVIQETGRRQLERELSAANWSAPYLNFAEHRQRHIPINAAPIAAVSDDTRCTDLRSARRRPPNLG